MTHFMKLLFAIFIIIAVLAGCKKSNGADGYYTITGLLLDWDSKAPIGGAKVYAETQYPALPARDSAVTDGNGKASFKYLKRDAGRGLYTIIPGYVYPFYSIFFGVRVGNNVNRTDSLFLARASYLNLNLHQSGVYNTTDSLHLTISGFRKDIFLFGGNGMTKVAFLFLDRRAMAADSLLNLASVYFNPPYQKAYIKWDVYRNGSVLTGGSDSTDLVQFGTKNYVLNY